MSTKIASLILAAGSSSRMQGKIKQLLPWKKTTLLGHAIAQATSVLEHCYVVLGANSEVIKDSIPPGVHIIYNKEWRQGMGSSIATGAASMLKEKADLDGILILLADQPLLDASYYNNMLENFDLNKQGIVATAYGNTVGVPAIFHRSFFSQLCALNQDFGAKQIIKKNLTNTLATQPKGKELDVDTIQNYNQLIDNKNIT